MEDEVIRANSLFDQRRFSEAFEAYRALAEAGCIGSQLRAGWMLETGCGVKLNREAALHWYLKASEQNSPEALFYVGRFKRAEGLYDVALEAFEKSAQQDYMPSIYQLGVMHKRGEGTRIDLDKAFKLYERAAGMGHLRARRDMAVLMVKGQVGFKRVPEGAMMLLRLLRDAIIIASKDPESDRIRW